MKNIRIALDLDDVLGDFGNHFLKWLNLDPTPPKNWDDIRFVENFHKVVNNIDFWMEMPFIKTADQLNFSPSKFVTARGIDNNISKKWLKKGGFKNVELVTVKHNEDKSPHLTDIHVFVDDAHHNYTKISESGINCFLMNRSHNAHIIVEKRLYDLNDLITLNPKMLLSEIKKGTKVIITDEKFKDFVGKEYFISHWIGGKLWGLTDNLNSPISNLYLGESQFKII